MGPSGSGKTSFLRALAGLWNSGSGTIVYYITGDRQTPDSTANKSTEPMNNSLETQDEEELIQSSKYRRLGGIFFLPQRPYMVLGTLRQQLLYPTWTDDLLLSSDDPKKKGTSFILYIYLYSLFDLRCLQNLLTQENGVITKFPCQIKKVLHSPAKMIYVLRI